MTSACVICTNGTIPSKGTFEEQLLVVFFLKRFFKYSVLQDEDEETFLQSLLQQNGNPANWIWFCPSCFKRVKEAQKAYAVLVESELKLESLRGEIETEIFRSCQMLSLSLSSKDPLSRDLFKMVRGSIYKYKNAYPLRSSGFDSIIPDCEVKIECSDEMEVEPEIYSFDKVDDEDFAITPFDFGDKSFEENEIIDGPERSPESKSFFNSDVDGADDDGFSESLVASKVGRKNHPKKSPRESRTCKICHIIFDKPSLMTRHYNSKHARTIVAKCDDCGKEYIRKDSLSKHQKFFCKGNINKEEKEDNIEDDDLDILLQNKSSSQVDMKEDHDDGAHFESLSAAASFAEPNVSKSSGKIHPRKSPLESRTCSVCNAIFDKPSLMTRHYNSKHAKTTIVKCDDCGETIKKDDLSMHQQLLCSARRNENKKGKGNSEAPLGQIATVDHDLYDHTNDTNAESDPALTDDPEFEPEVTLNKNLAVDPSSSQESRTCKVCHEVFDTQWIMIRHFSSKHSGTPMAKCNDCGKYTRKDSLPRHKKIFCPFRNTKGVQQTDCEETAEALSDDEEHENEGTIINPTTEALYQSDDLWEKFTPVCVPREGKPGPKKSPVELRTCPVCKEIFDRPSFMTRHVESVHSAPIKCDRCGKSYSRKDTLLLHQSVCRSVLKTIKSEVADKEPENEDVSFSKRKSGQQKSSIKSRTCKVCRHVFDKPSQMLRHLRSHHIRKGSFTCDTCNMKFARKDFFDAHKKTHVTNVESDEINMGLGNALGKDNEQQRPKRLSHFRRYENDIAGFMASDADEVSDPDFNDSASSSSYCTDIDDSDFELEHKPKKKSKSTKKVKTKQSGISDKSAIKPLNWEEERTCPVCKLVFSKPSAMKIHLNVKHERKLLYTCDVCSKGFIRKDYLKDHKLSHLSEEERNKITQSKQFKDRTCPVCNRLFSKPSLMTSHLNVKHERKNLFNCDICGRGFVRKDYLKDHMLTHMPAEEKSQNPQWQYRYIKSKRRRILFKATGSNEAYLEQKAAEKLAARTCPICNKIFKKATRMRDHLEGLHHRKQSFVCEKCGKEFRWKQSLQSHLKFHANGDVMPRPFKCTHCEKSFIKKRDLQIHEKIHSDVKEFLCSLCGMNFRHKASYKRHQLMKHTEGSLKSYDCNLCSKKFKLKYHLDQHMKGKLHGGTGHKVSKPSSSKRKQRKKNEEDHEESTFSTSATNMNYTVTGEESSRVGVDNIYTGHNNFQVPISNFNRNQILLANQNQQNQAVPFSFM